MDKQEFATLVKGSKAYFPNFALDKLQMTLWYDALDDLEYQTTQNAIKKLAQTTEFAPTIAAIRRAYIEIKNGNLPSLEQTMSDIQSMITKYGRYRVVEGLQWLQDKNPIGYKIIKAIGYESYANNQLSYIQPTIIKLHKEITESDETVAVLQTKFLSEIGSIKAKGLLSLGDSYE